jgi:hypothetical protein
VSADRGDAPVTTPTVGDLASLPSDAWAALLPLARATLHDLDDPEVTPTVRRLRAAPTGRLAGGRPRRELCALLAGDATVWGRVVARVDDPDRLPAPLPALFRGERSIVTPAVDRPVAVAPPTRDRDELDRLRARLRSAREERDRARRQADGAERRARSAEQGLAAAEQEARRLQARVAEVEERLAARDAAHAGELDRANRRQDGEVARLRATVAALRREAEERRQADARREAAEKRAEQAAAADAAARRARERGRPTRLRPGRPSVLPEGVRQGTRDAADVLLHRGRRVLVDGYNLTLQHQGELELEQQRSWLVQLLAAAAARRGIQPTVVFDGERAGTSRSRTGARGVEVRFTAAGITADDELVLEVEATDDPVVVVTDDRELAARVAASGADVLGTAPFLWAAR